MKSIETCASVQPRWRLLGCWCNSVLAAQVQPVVGVEPWYVSERSVMIVLYRAVYR
jgi:hypothetical protein